MIGASEAECARLEVSNEGIVGLRVSPRARDRVWFQFIPARTDRSRTPIFAGVMMEFPPQAARMLNISAMVNTYS
jgi:hypothetical protein